MISILTIPVCDREPVGRIFPVVHRPFSMLAMRFRSDRLGRLLFFLLLCAWLTAVAVAQDASSVTPAAQVEQILAGMQRGRSVAQVAISPDGRRLAWVQGGELQVAPIDNMSQSQPVSAGAPGEGCRASDVAWSPDSTAIAFLSDCADPGEQWDLYISRLDGSQARRLTTLHGDVNAPAFSPDGKEIAFLYVEGATRPAGALAAQDLPSGVIGEDKDDIQRVAMVAADAPQPGAATFVSPGNLHVYEFDWSPDSKSLAYIAADPPGENNWWVARLYTQTIGGSAAAILNPSEVSGALHGLQIAVPRWSPDGKWIAFIGGLMSDQGVTGGDVWVVSAAGAQKPVNLTAGRHETAAWISWKVPGLIDYSAMAGEFSQLRTLAFEPQPRVAAGNNVVRFQFPARIGDGRMQLSLSYARGQWTFIKSSFSEPPEIWDATDIAAECSPPANDPNGCYQFRQLSHFNAAIRPSWGKSVSLTWTNGGFHIQGWLMLPANYDPAKKYPMIVEVHGGPASAVLSRWAAGGPLSPAVFSDLGYFVLEPNPRGSFGQGEAFTQANRKDFGYGDLSDILAGVDSVLAKYPVDPHRIGITGWSYGGFMTMFAVTRTHRFRAAVAGAGISDWLSYYGENSIDQWMIPFFGASVYDDPAVYAKSSAINFIKNVTTPTLSVVGDRDGECPAPQSFEFWHALRDLHIPAELVVYPNEGHGLADPAHRRDVLERAAGWFAKYMP